MVNNYLTKIESKSNFYKVEYFTEIGYILSKIDLMEYFDVFYSETPLIWKTDKIIPVVDSVKKSNSKSLNSVGSNTHF